MLSHRCQKVASLAVHSTRRISGPPMKSAKLPKYDLVVVGGGIVGCATARQILMENPSLKVALVEKEPELAMHQSGRNSGVVHAGIYYIPGSLKAKLCVQGLNLSYNFFDEYKIPYKKTGKLIVAVEPVEVQRLEALFERAKKNACRDIVLIGPDKIREIEPHCRGLKALWSPNTGIVDWGLVTKRLGKDFEDRGGQIFVKYLLTGIAPNHDPAYPIRVVGETEKAELETKNLITCAGLQSDRVAALSGGSPDPKIVPFRGEYLLLKPEKRSLVHTNIYPVPDPRFPFLGVHFTPRMNGDIWLGPNAVLAYKREGYSYFSVSPRDLLESLSYSGMHKLMGRYMSFGLQEFYRGVWIAAQVKQLQRFIPELKLSDVTRGPAGVRAQAMDREGNLVDDFVFDSGTGELAPRILHVRNAPSPAATSGIAIAQMIAQEAKQRFNR